jgi:cell division inhibitor SulA/protein ImuA
VEWNDWHARIWRGRGSPAAVARAVVPTGFRELDAALPGGGWPLGAITEVLVDGYGIGELGLLMPALAALTKDDPAGRKKWVAWVSPPFVPYAPALQQRGVDVARLLMIHPTSGVKSRLWAIEQVVRSGSSAGVLAWVATGTVEDVILRRLQLAAEDQGCWVVLFRPASARLQRSPAALRIHLSQAPSRTATRVELVKCRGGRPGILELAGFTLDTAVRASRQ